MRRIFLKFILIILGCNAGSLQAQQNGNIRGTVVDIKTRQPLAGANVLVIGTHRGNTTNAEGSFEIGNMPEDVYKLNVSYMGYLSFLQTDVRVIRCKTTHIPEIGLAETVLQGSEVIVTPGLQAEIETLPVSSSVFKREEIRRTAGTSGDVLRAASILPGVSTTAGEFSTFSVRGGGPQDNLILVDNIPFDKISHFEGGSPEQEVQGGRFSVFSAGLIEEVNFSAGGYGPEYGRKSASVMDLSLKEGNIESPTVDGAFDPGGVELNYDGPSFIHDKTSLVFNARYYDYSRLIEMMDMAEFFYPAFGDFIFKTTTWLNANNRISLLGIYSKDDVYRDRKNVFAGDDLLQNDVWDISENRRILGLNWRLLTGRQSLLHNTVYYRGNERDRSAGNAWGPSGIVMPASAGDIVLRRDILTQNQIESEAGWKSDFTQILNHNNTLNAGIELFSIGLDYETVQNGNDTLYTFDRYIQRSDPALYYIVTTPETMNHHFNKRTQQFGAYLSMSSKIGRKFSVSHGVRNEINGFSDQSTWSPRLHVKYHMNARTALNAAAGIYYQNPLYSDITASSANTGLKNEKAIHAIVGISRLIGEDFKVTLEGYYKQFDDLIVRSDINLKNQGEGWSSGIDLLIQKRFTGNYYGQLTYSWSVSKRNDNDGLGEYNAPYSQPHIFNLLGGYEINKKIFVSAKLHCATGRPKHRFIVHENIFNNPEFVRYSQEITDRYAARMAPFIMLDMRMDYRQHFGRLALVTFVDLTNVLNRPNPTEYRFSELSGEEKTIGFGWIPTVGFKLEF